MIYAIAQKAMLIYGAMRGAESLLGIYRHVGAMAYMKKYTAYAVMLLYIVYRYKAGWYTGIWCYMLHT